MSKDEITEEKLKTQYRDLEMAHLESTIRELQADNETFSNDKAMLEISVDKLQVENKRLRETIKEYEAWEKLIDGR